MIGRLNHVAIAVPKLSEAAALYANALGAQVSDPLPHPEHGVTRGLRDTAEHQGRAAGTAG